MNRDIPGLPAFLLVTAVCVTCLLVSLLADVDTWRRALVAAAIVFIYCRYIQSYVRVRRVQ